MQAQDTEHSNTKMHTKVEAAEAKEAQARAELAGLRGQLHAQARENGTLQAEICELKRALAVRAGPLHTSPERARVPHVAFHLIYVRAPEAQLTPAETHDAKGQHPPFSCPAVSQL